MAAEIDIGSQMLEAFFSAFKRMPWYFWVFIIIAFAAKLMRPPKKRPTYSSGIVQSSQTELNEKLMPCPDCKGKVSINAINCPHCGAPIPASYVDAIKTKREKEKTKREKAGRISVIEGKSSFIRSYFLTGIAIISLILMSIIHFLTGWLMWVLVIFFGLLLICGLFECFKLRDKGKFGEQLVHMILLDGLPKEEYKIIDNVFLPISEGGTTQIDHIVVSVYGVLS